MARITEGRERERDRERERVSEKLWNSLYHCKLMPHAKTKRTIYNSFFPS
jgi:hypothetical protein